MRRRTIHALLFSYLQLWREGTDREPELRQALEEDLVRFVNARGLVQGWREFRSQLLGPEAARNLASDAFEKRETVRSRLENLGLATDTEFAVTAATKLLATATERATEPEDLQWMLETLFPQDAEIALERGWGPALSNLILNQALTEDEVAREKILDYALRDLELGDPRVSSVPWHPVGNDAMGEVIRWRSSEDLRFFFDLVMKGKEDYQGRHKFWKKYVDGVTRSLIVLSSDDEHRLRRRLQELEAQGRRFVRMAGTNSTSAFVMEFGRSTVVEFSEAGNACFLYKEENKTNFISWQAGRLSFQTLKNRQRVRERMRHVKGWEFKFTNVLARYGIRPIASRKKST
jgi:hypothetical protein